MTVSIMDAALYYAERKGFAVFPLKEKDKITAIKSPHPKGFKCRGECGQEGHGLWDAVKDPEHIRHWYTNGYSRCNVGIATGKKSGIIVLDVDPEHGGAETLKQLEAQHGELPLTPKAITGSGGSHYVFAHPGIEIGNSQGLVKTSTNGVIKVNGLGPGLDIRGDGGYIVAAPSIHPNGNKYTWSKEAPLSLPFAPMPLWMVEILTANKAEPESPAMPDVPPMQTGQDENVYPKGTRHAAMVSLAGTMRKRGMKEPAILAAILAEAQRFIPPATPSDIEALKVTVSRVCNYEPTAALATVKPGRVQADWSFCKSVYEFEINLPDFEWVKPAWFGDKSLSVFWGAFLELKNATAAATRAGILEDLEKWDNYDPTRLDAYAKEIARYGYLDGIQSSAENIRRMANDGNISGVTAAIQTLSETAPASTVKVSDANAGLDKLETMLETGSFIKTGFPHIDEKIGGLEVGGLTILAARPGMGKTSLSWQIARTAANDHIVFYISLEMPEWKLWEKAALGIAEVTAADVFNKKVSDEKMAYIRQDVIPGLRQTYQGRLYTFDQRTGLDTFFQMAAQVQPKLIFVDHLRYIDAAGESEVRRLGLISQRGKELAKKGDGCNVTMLHQLSRAVTGRDDKEPQLTDLRESGQIEENADQVLMLHRPDYYEMDATKTTSKTHLLVRKNRSGVSEIPFYLEYNLKQQWFYRQHESILPKLSDKECTYEQH